MNPVELRLLTPDYAEAFWYLRLEALSNDPASFADSAEEHLTTTVETARERCARAMPHVTSSSARLKMKS